ncbi:MAG: hypothetical protein GY913_35070 [Proteobacteria bacterium]|nr:hypothetical protein [Pseudomonadota bacterium]MCP4922152.1 hypothetical protein [Pseudomonadota bacterium]
MSTLTSQSQIIQLLSEVLPQQESATLRSPGQPPIPGTFFAPERRSIPFLTFEKTLRPRAGVPLEGDAGAFRFYTQLFAFEGSCRMRLAMPATIEVRRLARQVRARAHLAPDRDGRDLGPGAAHQPQPQRGHVPVQHAHDAHGPRSSGPRPADPRRKPAAPRPGRGVLGPGRPRHRRALALTKFLVIPPAAERWLRQATGLSEVA